MRKQLKRNMAFGIGAIGKDMVYALSSGFVMYYYQDLLGLSASFVGVVLMAARIFDAANDPLMGVMVAKTHSHRGRFVPWLFSGTVLNALVLYALFAAPHVSLSWTMVYFAIVYVLWGITYTMMDIPFWSLIPAITEQGKERETLTVIGRTCAGLGNALITVGTVIAVQFLGGGDERIGFARIALVVSVLFLIFEWILIKALPKGENHAKVETTSVKEMIRALFHNDQAMVVVVSIILINCALYATSNLLIYFFKYDISGDWQAAYTKITMLGGVCQIVGMMILYPLLHKKQTNEQIFCECLLAAIFGYVFLFLVCLLLKTIPLYMFAVPAALIFGANGILTVLTTLFLSGAVDYGEYKTGHRDDSVIFSMQTFVVKAASGFAILICGIGLDLLGFGKKNMIQPKVMGLRIFMAVFPLLLLLGALVVFRRYFQLHDAYVCKIAQEIAQRKKEEEQG